MYELSSKLDLSINIKFPTSKTLKNIWQTSVQYLVNIIGLKKTKIKDRKNLLNMKGEFKAEIKIMNEMSFIFEDIGNYLRTKKLSEKSRQATQIRL